MTATTKKLALYAPKIPGARETLVGEFDTIAEAVAYAQERFGHRKDLRGQDVYVQAGNRIIKRCGPCR